MRRSSPELLAGEMRFFLCTACLAVVPLLADDAATIVNSGSTNTPGFEIVVERSGKAAYTETRRRAVEPPEQQPKSKSVKVPKDLVKRLYADLASAQPLAQLPRHSCLKSASFGTVLTIELGGDMTPDLNCGDGGDSRMKALIQDAADIEKLFSGKPESAR